MASTFEDALTAAYETNPRIKAERNRLESTDENLSLAVSGFRPTIGVTYDRGREKSSVNGAEDVTGTTTSKSLRLEQPLFRGGGTISSLQSAKQRVKAGQFDLMATEQQVLLDAVTVYMDVVAASSLLDLSRKNESVLSEQLRVAKTRFQVGEVTRTDVAQSQSRLSEARSSVIAAEGQLVSAVAAFERVVGYKPMGEMAIPGKLPELPLNLNEALERGRAANPQFLSAIHTAKSARYDIRTYQSHILPSVSLVGAMTRDEGVGIAGANTKLDQDSIGVEVTIPLYQSGAEYARVRAAKAVARSQDHLATDVRQSIDQSVTQGWEEFETAVATITARTDQIKAAEVALEGVKQEHQYGSRTLLDVLDAERELFTARSNLVRADRDRVVAAYTLAFRLGQMTPAILALHVTPYDPQENADAALWQPIGF